MALAQAPRSTTRSPLAWQEKAQRIYAEHNVRPIRIAGGYVFQNPTTGTVHRMARIGRAQFSCTCLCYTHTGHCFASSWAGQIERNALDRDDPQALEVVR